MGGAARLASGGMIERARRGKRGRESGKKSRRTHRHTHAGTCKDSLAWLLSAQMLDWGGAWGGWMGVCACV